MSRFTDLFQEQEPVSAPEPISAPEPVSAPPKIKTTEAPRGAYRPSNNPK